MALFLKDFYAGNVVAANDMGAINYIADIRCLDLYGLASMEVADLKRAGGATTPRRYIAWLKKTAPGLLLYTRTGTRGCRPGGSGQGNGKSATALSAPVPSPFTPSTRRRVRSCKAVCRPFPAAGRLLVKAYYRCSPPAAAVIARRPWLRTGVRLALLPLTGLARTALRCR